MTAFVLPKVPDVTKMLEMLLGDGLTAKPAAPLDAKSGNIVALYVSPDGKPVAAGVCDTAFAAYAGAALSMIPPGGAKDAAKSGDLSATMMGNVHEVMNICSRFLMNDATPHLKLATVHRDGKELPDGSKAFLGAALPRLDMEIDIPRYGKGRLSLLIT
ncbi:MAG: hypothetical protein U1F68_04570 [Gammaproteobacteria bacterium]